MDSRKQIEEQLRARAAGTTPPPRDVTRAFLQSYVSDADSLDEVREEAARAAAHNPDPIRATLEAIEALIADPPRDGTLSYLVAVEANRQLPDPSDEGALQYLYRLTTLLREVLADGSAGSKR